MTYKCPVCGREFTGSSSAGPVNSHFRKHVRDGQLTETDGVFKFKGKIINIPSFKKTKEKYRFANWYVPKYNYSSTNSDFKIQNNKILIRCRQCNKFKKASRCLIDERFIRIICCDVMSWVPTRKREIKKWLASQ